MGEEWLKEYDGKLLFSHGSSNQKGVIVGFSKQLDVTIENTTRDKHGRILIVDVILDSVKYTIINIQRKYTS